MAPQDPRHLPARTEPLAASSSSGWSRSDLWAPPPSPSTTRGGTEPPILRRHRTAGLQFIQDEIEYDRPHAPFQTWTYSTRIQAGRPEAGQRHLWRLRLQRCQRDDKLLEKTGQGLTDKKPPSFERGGFCRTTFSYCLPPGSAGDFSPEGSLDCSAWARAPFLPRISGYAYLSAPVSIPGVASCPDSPGFRFRIRSLSRARRLAGL